MGYGSGRRLRPASWLLLLLAAGCAGASKEQLAGIDRLTETSRQVQPAVPEGARLSLAELVDRAQRHAPAMLASEVRAIVGETDFDQEASAGLPRIGFDADAGRSVTVRRDDSGLLHAAPSLSWDVVRMLQRGRMKRLRVRSAEAADAQRRLGADQIEVEVTRRYAELEAARTSAAVLRARAATAAAQARIAELGGIADPATVALAGDAETLARQADSAAGRAQLAETRIDALCGPGSGAAAESYAAAGSGDLSPLPLGPYLHTVVATSAGLELADIQASFAEERARLAKAERWSKFNLSSSAGNVLDLLSASPLVLLNWSYALLDQGDFNRQLVKARADAVLARLNRAEEADRLLDTGGRVWIALLDAATERTRAAERLRQAQLAQRVAAAQLAGRVGSADAALRAEAALAEAQADVKLRALDHLIADTQYRVLGGFARGQA
jgi:outer membrane protein TolC